MTTTQLTPEHRAALSAIGRMGGRAGVGDCKVRSAVDCRRAAKARWSKHRETQAQASGAARDNLSAK